MEKLSKRYTAKEACNILSISRRTLGRMIKEGEIDSIKYRNRHYFSEDELLKFKGINKKSKPKGIYLYSRVSSHNQKKDLDDQKKFLEEYASANGYKIEKHFTDIGSGLNFKRKNLLKLIKLVLNSEVKKVIITYEDRLVRFAFDLLKEIFSWYNTEIIIINTKTTSPQEELVEDLMTIIHVFSSRLYGLRSYKNKIKKDISDAK
jgi:excisionase family DNA binding protein